MSITVIFKDFEEMQAFAERLLGASTKAPLTETPKEDTEAQGAPVPVTQTSVTATPVPVAPTAVPVVPTAPAASPVTSAPTAVPTTAPTYTMEDLAKAAMTLMDAGRQNDLIALLNKFGVSSLPDLPTTHYGAFATDLRGLGAQI